MQKKATLKMDRNTGANAPYRKPRLPTYRTKNALKAQVHTDCTENALKAQVQRHSPENAMKARLHMHRTESAQKSRVQTHQNEIPGADAPHRKYTESLGANTSQ